MTEPCGQGPQIVELQKTQAAQNNKLDRLHENQTEATRDLKTAISELTKIVRADIQTRAEVEQLKKDREILFSMASSAAGRLEEIELRNAKCDGAGIFENFPKVWNWYQQELGWRRFAPAAMTIITGMLALYVTISEIDQRERLIEQSNHRHPSDVRMP